MAAAVIWLHGLGDVGDSWMGAFRQVQRGLPQVRFLHPTAKRAPLTCDGGGLTTSWFDISTWRPPRPIGLEEPDTPKGLDETIRTVHQMFADLEKEGVPSERIVVGGFSQGGVASLIAGLTYPKRLGGIVSISGWATHRDTLESEVSAANKDLPVLYCYGTADPVIDYELSKTSASLLGGMLENLSAVEQARGEHQPHPQEFKAAEEFMIRCLAPGSGGGAGDSARGAGDAA